MKNTETLSLKNHKVLITGVSRAFGIGNAIAKRFLDNGASVAIHGNSDYDFKIKSPGATRHGTDHIAAALKENNQTIFSLNASDLGKIDEPKKTIEAAVNKLGSLDGLILNHAYSVNQSIEDITTENIDEHFNVNVRAAILMIQAFIKQVDPKKGGVITLFTSGQYLGPMDGELAYALSKEALKCLAEQLAVTLGPKNIRINCVNPGPVDTKYLEGKDYEAVAQMFPSGRWGMPDDAAKLVQFLHSGYGQWITGQTIASEGGFQRHYWSELIKK